MRIRELDGLRGIAVLAVLAYHYLLWLPDNGVRHYLLWLPRVVVQHGFLGVDLFFVLSGFLITSILVEMRNKPHYFKIFYWRRALRIFPPYLIVMAVYLATSLAIGRPGTLNLWTQYFFYYSSLIPGAPIDRMGNAVVPFVAAGLAVLWSLSVEEIYYTIWAPVVRFTNHQAFTVILVAMALVAPVLRLLTFTPLGAETYTFYCRMDGLAYGSIVALLIRSRGFALPKWKRWDRAVDLASVAFVLLTATLWIATDRGWVSGASGSRLLSGPGFSMADISLALIVFAAIRYSESGLWWLRPLRSRWLRSVGMISYTLYLVNFPLLRLGQAMAEFLRLTARPGVVFSTVVGVGLSFAVSYAMWYGVEARVLRFKDRVSPTSARAHV